MPVEFKCTNCNKQLRVPDSSEGKKCRCPSCQTILDVPFTVQPEAIDSKLEVPCPRCNFVLVCDSALEGTRGLCPNCKLIFTIDPGGKNPNSVQEASGFSTFAFQCPHCRQLFEGKPGMEGRNGKCINCKKVFQIKKHVEPVSLNVEKKIAIPKQSVAPKPLKPISQKPASTTNPPKLATKPAATPLPGNDWFSSIPLPTAPANPYSEQPNPYATSVKPISYGAYNTGAISGDSASVRQGHLAHESAIKGFALLFAITSGFYILFAFLATIFCIYVFATNMAVPIGVAAAIYAVVYFVLGSLVALVSSGLYRLNNVGKVGAAIFCVLGLCAVPVGTIMSGYLLYLLLSEKGTTVFSERYRSIVRQTPHIRPYIPVFVWVILGLTALGFIILFIALIGTGFRPPS